MKHVHLFFAILLISIPCLSAAALTVVADLGGIPTAPFFEGINDLTEPKKMAYQPLTPKLKSQATVIDILPVSTSELTPGMVESRRLQLPGMRATFIVGDDALSRRWLHLKRDHLLQLNAIGLVTNVSHKAALDDLQQHAEGLELLPVSVSDLAQRLQLTHYPLLITEKGLEQ
ncbi:integrating conjugative element protein [Enterobacter hormaechei]|uniref:integrating conjugative element protein n=1 Tax=Enterobacter hormaechei TaxID=158836 RepID=UPI0032DACF22